MYDDTNVPQQYVAAIDELVRQTPAYPEKLIESLGGARKEACLYSTPLFTGWKGYIPGLSPQQGRYEEGANLEDRRYCAQWLYWWGDQTTRSPAKLAYAAVPAAGLGFYERGGTFDVGTDFVVSDTAPEVLEELVRAGFDHLMRFVRENI